MGTPQAAPARRRNRIARLAAVGAALCLLAACSDSNGGGDESTTSVAVSADTSAAGQVTAEGFAFKPADLSVAAGTTVTWTNNDSADHTVVGSGISGKLPAGGTFQQAFPTAGTFTYACTIHPSMTGTITVT